MRVIIAIISFLKQMWWPVLIAGRLWSVQQHRQNKKISKTAQTRIYGWTKHRRSFNIRDVAHVEYLYAIPKKMPMTQGVIVIRYYLALRGAENGVTVMVTPFFCVQG